MKLTTEHVDKFIGEIDGVKIEITIGKHHDSNLSQTLFVARSNYKNVFAIAENKDKAIKECIDSIKFKKLVLEGKVMLLDENTAITLAKKEFGVRYKEQLTDKNVIDCLSFYSSRERNILIITVTYSESTEAFENQINTYPTTMVTILVDLIKNECEFLESENIKW